MIGIALRVLLVAIALLAGAPAAADERWFELSLDGVRCGHVHGSRRSLEGGLVESATTTVMRLSRGGQTVEVRMATRAVETERGVPVEASVERMTGAERQTSSYRFRRDEATRTYEVTIEEGGRRRVETIPDDGWLAPAALERFIAARLEANARSIEFRALDLESGVRVVATTMERSGESRTSVPGADGPREIPVSEWSVRTDRVPIPMRELYASDGELVESVLSLGIGELRSRRSTREAATRPIGESAEVLVRSFVPASEPIRGPRERTRLVMVVGSRGGAMPELPSAGAQRVRRLGPNELEVEVDADRGSPAEAGDAEDPRYLAATALIDHDAPAIAELLARERPKRELAPRERAEHLRRVVARWIGRKDLASAFASASEAATARAGDCTEHAVLLAALLRAEGVPARIASGLVYADRFAGERNVWGWHLWTQALVPTADGGGHEWIDLDATLPTRFDAAHLLTAVGDLAGGATDPMWLESLGLIGNLSIEVRDAARTRPVREPAR